jgi:hypothetical protein
MFYFIFFLLFFSDTNISCEKYLVFKHIGLQDKPVPSITIYDELNCAINKNKNVFLYEFGLESMNIDSLLDLTKPEIIKDTAYFYHKPIEYGMYMITYHNKSKIKILGYINRNNMLIFLNKFYKILETQKETGGDKMLLLNLLKRLKGKYK